MTLAPNDQLRLASAAAARGRSSLPRRRTAPPWWFAAPAMALFAFIVLIPSVRGVYYAFTDWDGLDPSFSMVGLDNFGQAWQQGGLGGAVLNSTLVTIGSVIAVLAISALAAYPLARVTARWSKGLYLLVMLGLVLPFQLASLPLYQTMRDLGLLGTPWALILFYSGLLVPFTTFLYVGFMRALPRDFEDAALIDGCTPLEAFHYVVFPMLKPITVTALVLNAVAVWNDFFTPLLYLSGTAQQTLPVAISGFVGQYITDWNLIFAALVISIVPILVVYFALQRSIISGFAGGLKG